MAIADELASAAAADLAKAVADAEAASMAAAAKKAATTAANTAFNAASAPVPPCAHAGTTVTAAREVVKVIKSANEARAEARKAAAEREKFRKILDDPAWPAELAKVKDELTKAEAVLATAKAKAASLPAPAAACAQKAAVEEDLAKAQKAADEAKKLADKVKALETLEQAAKAAAAEAAAAQTTKNAALDKRIAQFSQGDGHGPARHLEPDPAKRKRKTGARALYTHDPETGSSIQHDGSVHTGSDNATSFADKEDYVLAEARCRETLEAAAPTTPKGVVEPKLADALAGAEKSDGSPKTPGEACSGRADTRPMSNRAEVLTSDGMVRQAPLAAGVVKNTPADYPPIVFPAGLPTNREGQYKGEAKKFFREGGNVAAFNATFAAAYAAALGRSPPLTPAAAYTAASAAANALPKPNPVSPAPTAAELDGAAIDLAIEANTADVDFEDANCTGVYKKVDGQWLLTTMYPSNVVGSLPAQTAGAPANIDLSQFSLGAPRGASVTGVADPAKLPPGMAYAGGPPPVVSGTPTKAGVYAFEIVTNPPSTPSPKKLKLVVK